MNDSSRKRSFRLVENIATSLAIYIAHRSIATISGHMRDDQKYKDVEVVSSDDEWHSSLSYYNSRRSKDQGVIEKFLMKKTWSESRVTCGDVRIHGTTNLILNGPYHWLRDCPTSRHTVDKRASQLQIQPPSISSLCPE